MENLFNTDLFEQYKLDPALRQALERLNATTKSAMENMAEVSKTMTPVQSFLQMGASNQQFLQDLDWMNVYKNFFQPSTYTQPMESFRQIQEEALKKFAEGQQAIFESFSLDSQNMLKGSASIDKPQQAIASYIEKSLDTYEDLKGKMAEQGTQLSSVNSAYMSWVQQTLQALSAAPAEDSAKKKK